MKIAFYIDFANMTAGGLYVYAKGVLSGLINSPEIEKIYLVYSRNVQSNLNEIITHPKIESIVFNGDSKFYKFRLACSFFLLNTTYIYTKDLQKYFPKFRINRIRKWAYRINPLRRLFNKLDVDVVHVPLNISPVYGLNKPLVLTIHDVQELHFPQYFDASERMRRAINYKVSMDEADKAVVWFEHIKEDVIKYFGKTENFVEACLPPVIYDWFYGLIPTSKEDLREKFGLNKPYILYPAATWEHKNHLNLVSAISLLRKTFPDIRLICTGHQTEFYKIIEEKLRTEQIEYINFLGIVSEKDLLGLYQNAQMVVFPSLYEGGGIPIFEAMRMEIPVLCSDIYPFRQSLEDENYMFDPCDITEIAEKIGKMLSDQEFRRANILNSQRRMNFFKEKDYCADFVRAYYSAVKNYELRNSKQ